MRYEFLRTLLLAYLDVANGNRSAVVVYTPAVLLDSVDTLGVGTNIIDVHHNNRIVGVDVDVIDIVSWTLEIVAVDAFNESLAGSAFLFEVYLTPVFTFGIYHHGVVLIRVSTTNQTDTELVPIVGSGNCQ